ncbi:hypothetical protein PS6_006221 [Mucor atramentarius]
MLIAASSSYDHSKRHASSDIKTRTKTTDTDTLEQEDLHQTVPKDAVIEQHTRSRSFSSLQSIFTRQKRPSLQRTTSHTSAHSTIELSSCTSSSSCSVISSNSSKQSTFRKIGHLFPFKGNNKSALSLANKSALLSQKSLEFEALLEEYPSRTVKTSLTPCTAA